jgi:hypothetical protein
MLCAFIVVNIVFFAQGKVLTEFPMLRMSKTLNNAALLNQ